MKIYKKNNSNFSAQQVSGAAQRLGLPVRLVELLFLREMDSDDKILKFLHQKDNSSHDPFLMQGMQEIVERIKQAGENNEKVVIYCDYDADGICAGAILTLFLGQLGADVFTYVPSRSGDGYGLHIDPLEKLIEEFCPDLILTCDCGISGAAEVEFVQELGVDIIVTDHHEVPPVLPACPVLNPHISGCGYPFEHLCGAGVALKLVEAVLGEAGADEYTDLAAIATVADLVPLKDENRLIVQRGLSRLKKRTNMGLAQLIKRLDLQNVTSTDIAFKLAPRINAAGRMGEAGRALKLLISRDADEIDLILTEIETDNNQRKQVCDQLFNLAIADLRKENLSKRKAIVLSYPDWEKGITGIVAARLSGEFKRPTFIMVRSGEQYKGTARGIEGVNVYKILVAAAHLLVEFGGHEQAAGFSILQENIPLFKQKVDECLSDLEDELFLPAQGFDLEIQESELTHEFVSALDLLEPFGNGNPRPLFCLHSRIASVVPLKSNHAHTQISTKSGMGIMAFNFANKNQILLGDEPKTLVIEAQLGFGGTVRGLLKSAGGENLYIHDALAKANYLKTLQLIGKTTAKPTIYDQNQLASLADGNIFGTLFIAGCKQTFDSFMLKHSQKVVLAEFIYSTTRNNYTKIIVSPDFDHALMPDLYQKIVFLDTPLSDGILSFLADKTDAEIFIPQKADHKQFVQGIDLDRETFGRYFQALGNAPNASSLYSLFSTLNKTAQNLEISQFMACLMVFHQLKLVSISKTNGFSVTINKGTRTELADSSIYQKLAQLLQNKD